MCYRIERKFDFFKNILGDQGLNKLGFGEKRAHLILFQINANSFKTVCRCFCDVLGAVLRVGGSDAYISGNGAKQIRFQYILMVRLSQLFTQSNYLYDF